MDATPVNPAVEHLVLVAVASEIPCVLTAAATTWRAFISVCNNKHFPLCQYCSIPNYLSNGNR